MPEVKQPQTINDLCSTDLVGTMEGVVPNDRFIEALMHAVRFAVFPPTDKFRREYGLSDSVIQGGLFYNSKSFLPPREIIRHGRGVRAVLGSYEISDQAKLFWQTVSRIIIRKAQKKAYTSAQMTALQEEARSSWKGIRDVFLSYGVGDNDEHLYLNIDTAEYDKAKLASVVGGLTEDIKAKLRRALITVLSDKSSLKEVQQTAEVLCEIHGKVVLAEHKDYIDYARSQVENPEELAEFTAIIEEAIRVMGIDDLEVEILGTEDHILNDCCSGLYTSGIPGIKKAKISIPMTVYGTTQRIPWREVLEIVAHEIAHHRIAGAEIQRTFNISDLGDGVDGLKNADNPSLQLHYQALLPADSFGRAHGLFRDLGVFPNTPEGIAAARSAFRQSSFADHDFMHTQVEHDVLQRLHQLRYGTDARVEEMPTGTAGLRQKHTSTSRKGFNWGKIFPWMRAKV